MGITDTYCRFRSQVGTDRSITSIIACNATQSLFTKKSRSSLSLFGG